MGRWHPQNAAPSQANIGVRFSDTYTFNVEDFEIEIGGLEYRIGNLFGGLLECKRSPCDKLAVFVHPSVKCFLLENGLSRFEKLVHNSQPVPLPLRQTSSGLISMRLVDVTSKTSSFPAAQKSTNVGVEWPESQSMRL